jgi:sigma-B regulation protein RsbU (phosphoserine phosphatase)
VDEDAVLETGDTLILYSDGITEAHDPHGPLFGEERLFQLAKDHARASVDDLADGLVEAAVSYTTSPPRDDIALIALRLAPYIRKRR